MELLSKHPIVIYGSIIFTVISIAANAAGVWWYINDERERSISQIAKLEEIRSEQEKIRRELATQTLQLTEIRGRQTEIEGGQRWLSTELNRTVGEISIELGRISERHRLTLERQ